MIDGDWNREAGEGTHATLSPYDTHNTLVACGPDFRSGREHEAASSNIDVAPTILRLLGISAAREVDGRVLSEAASKRQ